MKALKTFIIERQSIGKGDSIPSDVIAKLKEQKDENTKESGYDRFVRLGVIEGKKEKVSVRVPIKKQDNK